MFETILKLNGTNANEGNYTEYHWTDEDFFDALRLLDGRLEAINFSLNDVAALTITAK